MCERTFVKVIQSGIYKGNEGYIVGFSGQTKNGVPIAIIAMPGIKNLIECDLFEIELINN